MDPLIGLVLTGAILFGAVGGLVLGLWHSRRSRWDVGVTTSEPSAVTQSKHRPEEGRIKLNFPPE